MKHVKKGTGLKKRQKAMREPQKTFLIVCEGENTEPSYFGQFKKPQVTVKTIGTGCNTLQVIERAYQEAQNADCDEIWCVFDADPKLNNPKQIDYFNRAVQQGKTYKFGIAYSHQAFEYWFILHFEDHQGGHMPRTDYHKKINYYLSPLGLVYGKDKIITPEIFKILREKTEIAIKRAKKIDDGYRAVDPNCRNPGAEESSTTVFQLVEKLLQ